MIDQEIDAIMKRNFRLTSVPVETIKEFKKFCDEECAGVYSVGLIQLLKTKKLYENLIPLIASVLQEVSEIKSKMDNQTTKHRRTFE